MSPERLVQECSYIAVLLIIAEDWKQPRYPSTGEWISETVVYSCNEVLLSNKKEKTSDVHMRASKTEGGVKNPNVRVHSVWYHHVQKQAKLIDGDVHM